MKLLLTLALALVFILPVQAQSDLQKHFQSELNAYYQKINSEDWDSAMNWVYPGLFEVLPRDQMVAALQQMVTMGMKIETEVLDIQSISEVVESGSEKFCLVNYQGKIKISLSEALRSSADALDTGLRSAYSEGSKIEYNEEEGFFMIEAVQQMIAVSPKEKQDWKYMEYSAPKRPMFAQFIPEEVLVGFGL